MASTRSVFIWAVSEVKTNTNADMSAESLFINYLLNP